LFAVAKDSAALTVQKTTGKDGYNACFAVRILSWSVHIGERQRRVIESVKEPKGVEVVVNNFLGHAVGRDGMLRMLLINRKIFRQRIAVDRSAA